MEDESPLQSVADTALELKNTFLHPEGLFTARNLVRLLYAHKMEEDKRPKELPSSQQTLMNSFHVSRPIRNFTPTMPDSLKQVLTFTDPQAKPRKRKSDSQQDCTKKPKLDKPSKEKRPQKPKAPKKELAKYKLDHAVWMRILEFTPPQFLGKARLICKEFRSMVDQFTSIYVNCRKENYGSDMPPPPLGLSERQYSNLLGTKGCLEPGCPDKGASRTHWSWAKRWCVNCWKGKIEREDRLIKNRADRMGNRITFMKLLECIPVGMHDSFMKPHDYIDVDDNRPRGAPRLYKYYLKAEVEKVIERYEALDPEPYRADPNKSQDENAAALVIYQDELSKLDDKRTNWLAAEKAKIDEHMALVQRIEAGVRYRRESYRTPYDKNRNARKELFTRRAMEDLPLIPEEFVKNSKAFKAATRVFRDGGTERGWQTLKPKIEKEWASRWNTKAVSTPSNDSSQMDGACDDWQQDPDEMDYDHEAQDIGNAQGSFLSDNNAKFGQLQNEFPMRGMARAHRMTPALPPPSSLQMHDTGDWGFPDNKATQGFAGINTFSTKQFQNATRTDAYGASAMFAAINKSQTNQFQNNFGYGPMHPPPLDNRNTTPWPYMKRALPSPSFPTFNTYTSPNYSSYPASSTVNVGPLFPGVIPNNTAPPSDTSGRIFQQMSIDSLVNKSDS